MKQMRQSKPNCKEKIEEYWKARAVRIPKDTPCTRKVEALNMKECIGANGATKLTLLNHISFESSIFTLIKTATVA